MLANQEGKKMATRGKRRSARDGKKQNTLLHTPHAGCAIRRATSMRPWQRNLLKLIRYTKEILNFRFIPLNKSRNSAILLDIKLLSLV